MVACAGPRAQTVDRSKPPTPTPASSGGFVASQLKAPPTIDGRTWIEARPIFGPAKTSAPNGQFTLTLEAAKPNEDTGDLAGYRFYFSEGLKAPVEIGPAFTNHVLVTPDSRWIVTLLQLHAIDVVNWRQYNLREVLQIDGYPNVRAVSADGRRLFITTQPCPFDCQGVPNLDPYHEIRLP
jgi:hypothetical protein